jgi:hypothetical protein
MSSTSSPPLANSFVIGTAVINTHTHTRLDGHQPPVAPGPRPSHSGGKIIGGTHTDLITVGGKGLHSSRTGSFDQGTADADCAGEGAKKQPEDSDTITVFDSDIKGPSKHKKPKSGTKLKHKKV